MKLKTIDGEYLDPAGLSAEALKAIHFDQEVKYAAAIKRSLKGSEERERLFREGYALVQCIQLIEGYGQRAGSRSFGYRESYVHLVAKAARKYNIALPKAALLEIGLGSGSFFADLHRKFGMASFGGCEPDHNQFEEAIRLFMSLRLQVDDIYNSTFIKMPISRKFDIVYWNDVLEHVPEDEIEEVIGKIAYLLNANGILVTITPNWHLRPTDVTRHFMPPGTESMGFHLREYTMNELGVLFAKHGLQNFSAPIINLKHFGQHLICRRAFRTKLRIEKSIGESALPFNIKKALMSGFAFQIIIAQKVG